MNNTDFRKAKASFIEEYGQAYYDSSHILDFGFSILPRVIQYSGDYGDSKNLSSDAKICLAIMMDIKLNNELPDPQLYYPSQKRIAFLAGGLSISAVSRALKQLEEANLIGKVRRGQGKQNIYCLLEPPNEFVKNAIRRRTIIKLIQENKMDWTEIDENGIVIVEDEKRKQELEDLINAMICNSENQKSQACKTTTPKQPLPNGNEAIPRLPLSVSELTSVDVPVPDVSSDINYTSYNASHPENPSNLQIDEPTFIDQWKEYERICKDKNENHQQLAGLAKGMLEKLGIETGEDDKVFKYISKVRREIGDDKFLEILKRMHNMKEFGDFDIENSNPKKYLFGCVENIKKQRTIKKQAPEDNSWIPKRYDHAFSLASIAKQSLLTYNPNPIARKALDDLLAEDATRFGVNIEEIVARIENYLRSQRIAMA